MNRTQGKDYRMETYEINKISLSCLDDKIYMQNNEYDELALGYHSYLWKSSYLNNYSEKFLYETVKTFFFLVRTTLFLKPWQYYINFQSTQDNFIFFLYSISSISSIYSISLSVKTIIKIPEMEL